MASVSEVGTFVAGGAGGVLMMVFIVSRGQDGDGIGIWGKKEQGKQTTIGTERSRKDT